MEISKNYSRYDSAITSNQDLPSRRVSPKSTVKNLLEAFRIDFSSRALASSEINDPSINFPTHNPDVLQYNSNLSLTYKL